MTHSHRTAISLQHFHWRWEQDRTVDGLQHSHPEAVFNAIDTHHPHHEPRIITAYANERRAFVRCAITGRLHEHFHLDAPDAHERLARYQLHHFTGTATAMHDRRGGIVEQERRARA